MRKVWTLLTLSGLVLGVFLTSASVAHAGDLSPAARNHTVEIIGFKFVPEVLTVAPGDTITWINKDLVPHTATAVDNSYDTGQLKQNESKTIEVTDSFSLSYFCVYHPAMRASLLLDD